MVCILLIAACLCLAPAGTHAGDSPDKPRRILIIPSYNFDYKGIQWFLQGVMAEFTEHKTFPVTLSIENMQLAAHPSDLKYMDTMATSLKIKYSIEKPDLIIVQYKQALQFMERYGKEIFGDVPVVFAGLNVEGYIANELPHNYTGIMASFNATKNIELILKNHPSVRKIYVVGGASPVEQSMVNEAIIEGVPYLGKVEFIALTDMTFPALLAKLETIQDNSAIIYQALQLDAAGKVFVPAQAAIEIAHAARVPVYGMLDTYMGSGITGGFLIHHEGLGQKAANIARQWLQTGLAPDTRVKSEPIGSYRFDGRQLKRWGIREDSLPAGSKIEFKAFSIWDSYKKEIAGGVCLIFLQAALIIGLLWNRRERIKTTDALKETERFKSELLEKMNEAQHMAMIGSWEWNLQTNQVWWSDETYAIFGVTKQDFIPSFEENGKFIHPDDFVLYGKSFERCLQTGEPLNFDLRLIASDGRLKYCHASGQVIFDDSGQKNRFIGTIMDVTERRHVEFQKDAALKALQENEKNFRLLFDTSPDGIVIIGTDGRITNANIAQARMYRYNSPSDLIGVHATQLIVPSSRDYAAQIMQRRLNGENIPVVEYELVRKDGTTFYGETMATVMWNPDGKISGYICTTRDTTERRREEEKIRLLNAKLEQKVNERTSDLHSSQLALLNIVEDLNTSNKSVSVINESLDATNKELAAFSYSVSHDLRAPLRSIDGFSQALLEDYQNKLDDTGRNYLNKVRSAAQQMGLLIDDMLKLSRITHAEFYHESIDLSKIVLSIAETLQKNNPDKDVKITIQQGIVVKGDLNAMRIALTNLLDNAWKFTGKTENARIEFGMLLKDGKPVMFIRDNGAGFDMSYVDKLFGAFQRLHTKDEFTGTGIGLATVKRIITRHGGQVWAEGEVGKGATFFFTLPE